MGEPKNGWFLREIPFKWMIWGTPISGNHHIVPWIYLAALQALKLTANSMWVPEGQSGHSSSIQSLTQLAESKVWLLGLSEQSILCKQPSFGHCHIGNGALFFLPSKAKPLAALITAKGREALQSTIDAPLMQLGAVRNPGG